MFILSYDIEDDKRRNKVRNYLKDYGYRVQKSVFVFFVDDSLMEKILSHLKEMIDMKKDRLRLYKICKACKEKVEFFGISEFPEEEEVFVV